MTSALLEPAPQILRHRSLGSEAVYEVLDEADGVLTAAVISAPGLQPGMQIRMMASAARAMTPLGLAADPTRSASRFDRAAAATRAFAMRDVHLPRARRSATA
jgi:hypothetical protein